MTSRVTIALALHTEILICSLLLNLTDVRISSMIDMFEQPTILVGFFNFQYNSYTGIHRKGECGRQTNRGREKETALTSKSADGTRAHRKNATAIVPRKIPGSYKHIFLWFSVAIACLRPLACQHRAFSGEIQGFSLDRLYIFATIRPQQLAGTSPGYLARPAQDTASNLGGYCVLRSIWTYCGRSRFCIR